MLLDKLNKYNIYLASQSPRRHILLKSLGVNFSITSKIDVDETYSNALFKEEIALYLADKKADAYKSILTNPDRILITADTIVWLEGKVLGKPQDDKEAIEMLSLLSAKKHTVITAITISNSLKRHAFFCNTDVWFKKLNHREIEYYVKNFKPYDKAGAYGIQEWIGYVAVEKIEGSYYNVVGLPIQKLYCELEKFIDNLEVF